MRRKPYEDAIEKIHGLLQTRALSPEKRLALDKDLRSYSHFLFPLADMREIKPFADLWEWQESDRRQRARKIQEDYVRDKYGPEGWD
jgi:hypothetical protein